MTEMRELFERQAAWQADRGRVSWPEKVRMAEAVRESLVQYCAASRTVAKPSGNEGSSTSTEREKR